MEYARYDAKMRKPATEGSSVTTRATLEAAAARGVASAIKLLEAEPPVPEPLRDLWDQFQTLNAWRREGMTGMVGLTLADVARANDLFDWNLQPHEAEAFHALDIVSRFPDVET